MRKRTDNKDNPAISTYPRSAFKELIDKMIAERVSVKLLRCHDAGDAIAAQNKVNKLKAHERRKVVEEQRMSGAEPPWDDRTPYDNVSMTLVKDSNILQINLAGIDGVSLIDLAFDPNEAGPAALAEAPAPEPGYGPHCVVFTAQDGASTATWNGEGQTKSDGWPHEFPTAQAARDWLRACDELQALAPLPPKFDATAAITAEDIDL